MSHPGTKEGGSGQDSAKIQGPDLLALQAAEGWIDLGNATESLQELKSISLEHQEHAAVLQLKWEAMALLRMWTDACKVACLLIEKHPSEPAGWIHRSYAIRRSPEGSIQQALEALMPAYSQFPKVTTIPYNIACYHCQLGHPGEAWDWLHRAMETAGDVAAIKAMALKDEDLKPLWTRIREL